MAQEPTSTKPYFVRAIYEWCLDNGFTPFVICVLDGDATVPPQFARDPEITLNVGPDACQSLAIGNEAIEFRARFGGVAYAVRLPVRCLKAVYARENGIGMGFEVEPKPEPKEAENQVSSASRKGFRIV